MISRRQDISLDANSRDFFIISIDTFYGTIFGKTQDYPSQVYTFHIY